MSNDRIPKIGLLLGQAEEDYVQGIWKGALAYARAHEIGLRVFVGRNPTSKQNYDFVHDVVGKLITPASVDGLIVLTGEMGNYLDLGRIKDYIAKFRDIPIVAVSIPFPGVPSVLVENGRGISEAVDHLIGTHGKKRIGFIKGPIGNPEAVERFDAFRSALDRYGVAMDERLIVEGSFTPESGRDACLELLSRHIAFDALLASDDAMAKGALSVLRKNGIRVPEDVSLIGFDNTEDNIQTEPSLSSVKQPLKEQGWTAARLLHDMLRGNDVAETTILPTSLVVRESCGCAYDVMTELIDNGSDGKYTPHENSNAGTKYIEKTFSASVVKSVVRKDAGYREMTRRLFSLLGDLSLCFDLNDLKRILIEQLASIGITGFWIFLYKESIENINQDNLFLPLRSRTFLSYPEPVIGKEIEFDTMDLVPPVFFEALDAEHVFVMPLFFREEQYGFLLARIGSDEPVAYESLRTHIGSTLKSAILLQEREQAIEELKNAFQRLEDVNKQLQNLSLRDELTKLYNRRGFLELGKGRLSLTRRRKESMLLYFIDLDGLKYINDTYGHEEGDEAIFNTSKLLARVYREADLIARLGGDEFVALTMDSGEDVAKIIESRVYKAFERFNETSGKPYRLNVSIGYTVYDGEGPADLEELMALADEKLYAEKRRKKAKPPS